MPLICGAILMVVNILDVPERKSHVYFYQDVWTLNNLAICFLLHRIKWTKLILTQTNCSSIL